MSNEKMNRIVFTTIFSLMIIGAVLAIMKNQRDSKEIDATRIGQMSTTTSELPKGKDVTITYTARGFKPATTTLSKGDTVIILNKSNDSLWLVNMGYPLFPSTFDAKKPVITGQSYSFTFTASGTTLFRNNLKPELIGAVIVK